MAVQELANLTDEQRREYMRKFLLTEHDMRLAQELDFAGAVLLNTQAGDMWHVSDARGIARLPEIHGAEEQYQEGVAIGEGNIPRGTMDKIISAGLSQKIAFILEIVEPSGDYIARPETKKSLAQIF